jgi:hypothetical protein
LVWTVGGPPFGWRERSHPARRAAGGRANAMVRKSGDAADAAAVKPPESGG